MKFEEKDRITLCKRCASDFYNTDAFDIQRDYKSQDVGRCCYCDTQTGVDYFVRKKKQPNKLKKEA